MKNRIAVLSALTLAVSAAAASTSYPPSRIDPETPRKPPAVPAKTPYMAPVPVKPAGVLPLLIQQLLR